MLPNKSIRPEHPDKIAQILSFHEEFPMQHYVIGHPDLDPLKPVTIVFQLAQGKVVVTQENRVFTVHITQIEKR
jgi:hypothetical protein